jgi:putative tryptophan/tyrosine transport system substrate-binding protein
MRRRRFLGVIGGVAAWPVVARAQPGAMPLLGFLSSGSAETYAPYVQGFHRGLAEKGFVEGRNVALEFRWSQGQYEPLTALASDLVKRQVSLIVASGGPPTALAVKAATSTIPIVFTSIDDPIGLGLVASLNRPGGNATGMSLFRYELISKQLELLRELAPNIATISVLANETNPNTTRYLTDIRAASLSSAHHRRSQRSGKRPAFPSSWRPPPILCAPGSSQALLVPRAT